MDRRKILIDYLKMKTEEQDWHGVSDAANDLRVLDKEISIFGEQSKVETIWTEASSRVDENKCKQL